MSLHIIDNFKYLGKKFLDDRESFKTLEDMKNCTTVPDGFITYCQEDEKRYEFKSSNTINELTGKWKEFVVNADFSDPDIVIPSAEDCYYLGADEPADNNKIWFYTSAEGNFSEVTYDNPVIAELFACIQSMQAQIVQLQAEVEYLKLNGGGGLPIEPPDGGGDEPGSDTNEDIIITLEDGGFFLLEDDSGYLIMEETLIVSKDDVLVLEDGSNFLLEDGHFILLENTSSGSTPEIKKNVILLESGKELLLENNKNILLEN